MADPGSLELIEVTKRYGATTAVDAINLRVPSNAYCCLLGPSGCGKTSTLRMIAGHESTTEGDILIGDANVTDLPPAKRGTAMMFQSYALFPHLTCLDNVAFSLKMRGVDKTTRRQKAWNSSSSSRWIRSRSVCPRNCRAASSSAWRSRER